MRRALLALLLLAPLAAGCGGGGEEIPALPTGSFVSASGSLSPPIHLFGDTLTADVDVVVDRTKLDPSRLSLKTFFEPYEPIEAMEVGRREAGDLAQVRYRLRLRCLERACITSTLGTIQNPGGSAPRTFRFQPAQVQYTDPGAENPRLLRTVRFSPVESVTRINAQDVTQVYGFPFRGNVTPLPAISQRMSPTTLGLILLLLAAALLVLPATLLLRWWRERRRPPPPEPEPEPTASNARSRSSSGRWSGTAPSAVQRSRRSPRSSTSWSRTGWVTRRASPPGRRRLPRPARRSGS